MIKTYLLFFSQALFLCVPTLGQNYGTAYMYLTNYSISEKTGVIGSLKVVGGEINTATIDGDHALAFRIDKDHTLSARLDKLKSSAAWFDITISLKTSGGNVSRNFRIVRDNFIRNKVIAHRGAWKNTNVPENSIAALNHAVTLGCEGSEFDVHMSADSLPVVNHDPTIEGISIAKTNAQKLLTIKLANGENLPTLENYLNTGMAQTKTKLILEIKPSELGKDASIALARKVVNLVERLKGQGWVNYISFDYDACKEVIKIAPYANVAYLRGDKTPTDLAADGFFGLDYNLKVLQNNPSWIKDAKSKNLTVNVWTVNERPLLEYFLEQNVDFITTNEPELLLSIVGDR